MVQFYWKHATVNKWDKLLKVTTIGNIVPISASLHPFLNTSKGVFYSVDLIGLYKEIICDELRTQNVIKIKRIKRLPKNNEKDKADAVGFIKTPILIITFITPILPKCIKAGFLNIEIKAYIPNPMHNLCTMRQLYPRR